MRLTILVGLGLILTSTALGRTITDLAGRHVEIPDSPQRIACLEVLCHQRLLMLHVPEKAVSRVETAAPWMARTNPQLSRIPSFDSTPNLEEVVARRPDLAFINSSYGLSLAALDAAGIPALVTQPVRPARSAEEFIADAKAMVMLGGQVLGGESLALAQDWCRYFDDRLHLVQSRIAHIPQERRPRLYYVRGPEITHTTGQGGYFNWVAILAGARMVVDDDALTGANPQISVETLIGWNPDIIIMGRQYDPSMVLENPVLTSLSAVRQQKVWPSPVGVFFWDGGPEQVLLLQFLAKRLYPEMFADLDLAAEIRRYYARFYRTDLSDEEVRRLLDGRAPDGSRVNSMNN